MPDQVNNPVPIQWYNSQRFMAICQLTAYYIVFWLSVSFVSHVFDLYSLGTELSGAILLTINDWRNPNIVAPFAALNKNNVVPK